MDPGPETDPDTQDNADWRLHLGRAWNRRCPRCGAGGLFRSTFRLRHACPACKLVFRREDGGMTGQMYLSAAVSELLAVVLIVVTFLFTDWSAATSIAVCSPIVILFCYWSLPRFMALWVGIEYLTDVTNDEPWVRD